MHKYAYVHGDPIGNIDPSGEVALGVALAVSIGLTITALTISSIHETTKDDIYRSTTVGRGGRDITPHLQSLATNFKNQWQMTNYVLREQAIGALTSLVYSSGLWFPGLGAWDISQLATYPTKLAFEHPNVGPPCPRTVTVADNVYYVSDVNYFLWGYVHGLSFSDGTGGLSIESAVFAGNAYRAAVGYPFFGSWRPHDGSAHGRADWVRAGWRSARTGDFLTPVDTSTRPAILRHCEPSKVKYGGILTGIVLAGINPLSGAYEIISAEGS